MFNSTEEFEAKLLHYLHSEEERLAVVRNAQRLAYARCATRPPCRPRRPTHTQNPRP